jgi:hypothetical protein
VALERPRAACWTPAGWFAMWLATASWPACRSHHRRWCPLRRPVRRRHRRRRHRCRCRGWWRRRWWAGRRWPRRVSLRLRPHRPRSTRRWLDHRRARCCRASWYPPCRPAHPCRYPAIRAASRGPSKGGAISARTCRVLAFRVCDRRVIVARGVAHTGDPSATAGTARWSRRDVRDILARRCGVCPFRCRKRPGGLSQAELEVPRTTRRTLRVETSP